MNDLSLLTAQIGILKDFFAQADFEISASYHAILGYPERLPRDTDLLTSPAKIIHLNLNLRRNGFFCSLGWPEPFLAIGSDTSGNVLYFDATKPGSAVWEADHELCIMSSNLEECMGMKLVAKTFEDYAAESWNQFLTSRGKSRIDINAGSEEYQLLVQTPDKYILEMYFVAVASPYDLREGWRDKRSGFSLFFSIVNLKDAVAHSLLIPALEIVSKQESYGRCYAGLLLLDKLLKASRQFTFPQEAVDLAEKILVKAESLGLRNVEGHTGVMDALRGTSISHPNRPRT